MGKTAAYFIDPIINWTIRFYYLDAWRQRAQYERKILLEPTLEILPH